MIRAIYLTSENIEFQYNHIITPGLSLCEKSDLVLGNIRRFNLKAVEPDNDYEYGITINKCDSFAICTICLNGLTKDTYLVFQLLVSKDLDKMQVLDLEHPLLDLFKPKILDCIDVANLDKAEDVKDLPRLKK